MADSSYITDNDLIFDELEISGFLSFPRKKHVINLNTNLLTAIVGTNLDGGPGERNGAGKTAIIDAIQYVCFGRSSRVPSNKGYLNVMQKGPLRIAIKGSRSGIAFYFERGENPSLLRLYEKSTSDSRDFLEKDDAGKYIFETTKSTKPETTKRIVEILGFDLKLMDVLLVNNSSDKHCYFLKDTEEQRDIQERVFGFTAFTEKAKLLKELRREESRNLTTKQSALVATRQANDRVLAQITDLETKANSWGEEHDKSSKFLTQQIRSYRNVDWEKEKILLTERAALIADAADVERSHTTAKTQLSEHKGRHQSWETQHAVELKSLNSTIATLANTDADQDIKTLTEAERLNNAGIKLIAELAAIDTHRGIIEQSVKSYRREMDKDQATIAQITDKIVSLDDSKCPTCGQPWSETHDHLTVLIKELDDLNARIQVASDYIKDCEGKIAECTKQIKTVNENRQKNAKKIDELPKTHFKTIAEAASSSGRLTEIRAQLAEVIKTTNPHESAVVGTQKEVDRLSQELEIKAAFLSEHKKLLTVFDDLTDLGQHRNNYESLSTQFENSKNEVNPYREPIQNLRDKALMPVDETEIKALENQIEHISLMITLLTDLESPLRKRVLNKFVPQLNQRVGRYLSILELPYQVVFDSDMSASFKLNGEELTFGNLSTGQGLRVWLATNMAFRDIFERLNYHINLFFVDEVLDKGMSGRGAEVGYNLLNDMIKKRKSVFLITHRQELADMAENTLSVTLEKGLSRIDFQAAA